MATQTVVKFEDFKADGTVRRVRYQYDDVSLFLTAVLMFNNTTDIPLPAKATVNANGRSFSRTEPPGGSTLQTIATNAAQLSSS
jgi:hypothetical protein